jgi:hypothetical protein
MNSKVENIKDNYPKILYPLFLSRRYNDLTGNKLNLFFPHLLSEKVQWLKLFNSTKLKGDWADKVLARDKFVQKINDGEKYLKPLLGVWNNFDEIDFDKLPNQFILKLNHGCGFNSFVLNKENLLRNQKQFLMLKNRINIFFDTRYYLNSLELHYKFIKPRILAEEIIGGENSPLFSDWMIYCFNGEPKFANFIVHRKDGINSSYVYNENFEKQDFSICFKTGNTIIPKPTNYEKMFEFAKILSNDFKFVRVDFIEYEEKLYFAEMTFTPYSGYFRFNGLDPNTKEALYVDKKLGNLLKL